MPVVSAEHSDPRHQNLGVIWEPLRRRTYRHAAAVVVLTHAVADHLRGAAGDRPIYVVGFDGLHFEQRPVGLAPARDL